MLTRALKLSVGGLPTVAAARGGDESRGGFLRSCARPHTTAVKASPNI